MYIELLKEIELYMKSYKTYIEKTSVEDLNRFMRTIKIHSNDPQFIDLLNRKYTTKQKKNLGEMLINIECIIEKNSVIDFLEGNTTIIDEKMNRCSSEMVTEGEALGLTEKSHILLVGAGAMPISAAILLKHFNCTVTCVDIDCQAIALSEIWLRKLNLNSINFITDDIFNITDYTPYTHVIVTGHIADKNSLLTHLSFYLNSEQKILLRNSLGIYQWIYQPVTSFMNFEILDVIDHNHQMPYMSYIIKPIIKMRDIDTPFYLFDLAAIRRNYTYMCQLLKDCDKVFYALKANGEPTIINSMKTYGVPFEVSSIGEFDIVNDNSEHKSEIICSLPVKSEEMIIKLYEGGCNYFVFDCWEEYKKLAKLAPNALKIVRINITDISPNTIDYGMTENEFFDKYESHRTVVDGVTFYNIPNLSVKQIILILERCTRLLSSLSIQRKILNIGGNYRFESDLQSDFYSRLHEKLARMKQAINGLVIYAEPGRTIVKSAGMIFARVVSIRKRSGKNEVYIDAGLPSGILYPPRKIGLFNADRVPQADTIQYDFYANTCSKKLLFSTNMKYQIEKNDILILEEMGTYSLCKSNHFHGWELPQVRYCFGNNQRGE